ncbi:hypothetical protein CCHL11_01786 [Colletotrichum chlorophyti]|uniref:Uncharacterized protein n=1 Tax=Colletotrichum chlorophyti TaxID=708187 RepID=A0A1Q8RW27_9PEZI|nr:hypothetical protein CCHL11_01786 [Colletotrichum chlorophyti]
MSRSPRYTRATVLSILLFASARAATIPSFFERQATCAAANFVHCGNSLPVDFCCETGKKCIILAGKTTVLCCPEESDCNQVSTITCNISLQDAAAHPDAQIKTTSLTGKLPTCGKRCCPFGYVCLNDGEMCILEAGVFKPPPKSSSSSSLPSTTPESTSVPSVIPTTIVTSSLESPTAPVQEEGNGSKSQSVGLGVGLLLCLARRRRRNTTVQNEGKSGGPPRPSTSTSSFGNIISEPIPMSDSALRTDFILKTPSTVHSKGPRVNSDAVSCLSSSATTLANQPVGIARSDSHPRTPDRNHGTAPQRGIPIPPIRNMRPNSGSRRHPPSNVPNPLTPPPPPGSNLQREPSSESINVFADPRTMPRPRDRRQTSATTFTDMMEEAELGDVRRGMPYVPPTPRMPPQGNR